MSDERRRYARFYYERFRSEYPDIYANSTTLGDFVKLLVESELAWPNHPEFPRSVRRSSISTFVEAGLIKVVGYGYQLRGFAAERERRQYNAQSAASARWHPKAMRLHSNGIAEPMPKTKKKDEEELPEAKQGLRALDARDPRPRVQPLREPVS